MAVKDPQVGPDTHYCRPTARACVCVCKWSGGSSQHSAGGAVALAPRAGVRAPHSLRPLRPCCSWGLLRAWQFSLPRPRLFHLLHRYPRHGGVCARMCGVCATCSTSAAPASSTDLLWPARFGAPCGNHSCLPLGWGQCGWLLARSQVQTQRATPTLHLELCGPRSSGPQAVAGGQANYVEQPSPPFSSPVCSDSKEAHSG